VVDVSNFIGVYENAFSDEFCDKAIDLFHYRASLNNGIVINRLSNNRNDTSVTYGTEATIDDICINSDDAKYFIEELNTVFWNDVYMQYIEKCPILNEVEKHGFGSIKLQRTKPTGGFHNFHCENFSLEFGKRIAFVIIYLNDVEDGGETEFLYQSVRVKPKKGTVVIAPSSYTHAHRGNPPLSGEKYILTSWIEFYR
jgi:hypothetical protein